VTTVGWLAAAVGLALLPLPSVVRPRLIALGDAARLTRPGGRRGRFAVRAALGRGDGDRGLVIVGRLGVGAIAVAVGLMLGPVLGLAAGVLAMTGWSSGWAIRQRRRAERRRRVSRTAVGLLIAELEAGSRPEAALAAAAEAGDASFRAAADAVTTGGGVGAAFAQESGPPGLGVAWEVALRAGLPLAAALTRVADDLDARDGQAREVTVALAGARSSAALMAVLPVLGLLLGATMGARPLTFLLADRIGGVVTLAGVGLDALGLLWTRALAARAERS
jgi:tight adherence protein B